MKAHVCWYLQLFSSRICSPFLARVSLDSFISTNLVWLSLLRYVHLQVTFLFIEMLIYRRSTLLLCWLLKVFKGCLKVTKRWHLTKSTSQLFERLQKPQEKENYLKVAFNICKLDKFVFQLKKSFWMFCCIFLSWFRLWVEPVWLGHLWRTTWICPTCRCPNTCRYHLKRSPAIWKSWSSLPKLSSRGASNWASPRW